MLTKKTNEKVIVAYYLLALIFGVLGYYLKNNVHYIIAAMLLVLAFVRKFWLMGKLK